MTHWLGSFDAWPVARRWESTILPAVILLLGTLARVYVVTTTGMLHADEGMHLDTASLPSLLAVLHQVRVTHSHPPLYFLLLHACLSLTPSLCLHRLVNTLLVVASAFFFHSWLRRSFGAHAAALGLVLYFLSPGLIYVSSQVRGYSLLLLGITGSLYFLHVALSSNRRWTWYAFIGFLVIACLTHYSAVFCAAPILLYGAVRELTGGATRNRVCFWIIGILGLVALYAGLYAWHMPSIAPVLRGCAATYLARGLYHPGVQPLLAFLADSNASLLQYLFGRSWYVMVGALCGLFFLVHSVFHFYVHRKGFAIGVDWPLTAGLLALPLLASILAGSLGAYPHYGMRHSLFLLPFLAAAVGVGVSRAAQRTPLLRGSSVTLLLCYGLAGLPFLGDPLLENDQGVLRPLSAYRVQNASAALRQLKHEYRNGDVILLSTENNFAFRHYAAAASLERWPHYPGGHTGLRRVGRFRVFVDRAWFYDYAKMGASVSALLLQSRRRGSSVWLTSFLATEDLSMARSLGFDVAFYRFGHTELARLSSVRTEKPQK